MWACIDKNLLNHLCNLFNEECTTGLIKLNLIDHFTLVCLITWPLNESEAGVDLVLIETSLLFLCKFRIVCTLCTPRPMLDQHVDRCVNRYISQYINRDVSVEISTDISTEISDE